ncbi:hypothetical protein S40293_08597 [Stachybotrys chartarum IBT 40293]|nr:hypothetical protein S40293_08597 [Stachybotrys chartarum IBT 40293]
MVRLPSRKELMAPFQSREAFIDFIKAPQTVNGHNQVGNSKWSNKDLEPTPPEHRTWTWYNLPMYWFSNQFSLTGWNTASSLIATGLTWQQSFVSCILGSLLASVIVVLMARPGASPVLCRSSMGMYGARFFVFIRAVVCIIWYGIQTYYGASLMSVMFRCLFGSGWENFHNTLAENANIDSKTLLAFFIVWLLEFPFMWVHPRHIHYLFTVKGFTMPIATFAIFGWCMVVGAGVGGMDAASREGELAAAVTPLGWSIMSGINVMMGGLSPMLVNQPDLARYCQKPRDAGLPQGVTVFLSGILVFFLGLASTTSIQAVWGVAYWNIWDLLDAFLDHYWTPGARAAIFILGLTFLLGVFATNFGANSLPFGADMTGLMPRWLTIRRGQILCAILGVAVVPWQLIANAEAFLSFLGSYNIFMAPLCAVIILDYNYVRKGNIHVPSCYDGTKGSLYWFWNGVNWVGAAAWLLGTTMGIPGLIGQYQPQLVGDAARYMYMMGWILTFVTASVMYMIGTRFFNYRIFPAGRELSPYQWEWLANDGREGFFDEETDGGVLYGQSTPGMMEAEELRTSAKDEKMSIHCLAMSTEPYRWTATEVVAKIGRGEISVEQYAQSLLSRIQDRDPVVKGWAYLNPDQVLRQARALDQIPVGMRGPLHGVAVAVKDVIYTKDMPTQFNSPIYKDDAPKVDAGSIVVLRQAGALILGKTTTTEFAATTVGSQTTNPHDSTRTPGGSSSGSGAVVGDFQAPIGLGTQTGGSTIRPASFNGIYALKPTWNTITREGQKIYSLILDTLGIYARSAADLDLLADVFGLQDDQAVTSGFTIQGAKFAVCKTMVWPQAGPGLVAAMQKGTELLRSHGATVEEMEFPASLNDLPQWHATVLNSDGRTAFLPEYRSAKAQISDQLIGHVENRGKISKAALLEAFDKISAARPIVDEMLSKFDAVLVPSVPDEAPKGIESTGSAAFNVIWTALHTPVVNIPGFIGENGMPIGLSLVAPRYHDRHLLAVSQAVGAIFEAEGP